MLTGILMLAFLTGNADVRLPEMFQSHMVLQRNAPIKVWGWASSNEEVTVVLGGRSGSAKADKHGKWFVKLSALEAGGPFEMVVQGKNRIVLFDILLGDVWLCGGQSNMQWNISQTGYAEKDTALITANQVRLFTVYVDMDYVPQDDLKGSGWKTLTKKNVDEFSAVAYHFGKYLQLQLNVPIGLISDNLGATSVETWMSKEALLQFPQFETEIEPIVKTNKSFDELNSDFEKIKDSWYKKYYYKGIGIGQQWFKPDTDLSDWKEIKASGNTWEGEPDLKNHDGVVWFRTAFDLPKGYTQETFTIGLSQIDDFDIAWVNGVKIGETFGKHNHRNYTVPTIKLKDKGNVLVIRVVDTGGIGGFTTSPFWGNPILWGQWLYKKGESIDDKFRAPNLPNATPFSSPGVLYNAIIAPLTPLSIKGVIWYQGESNADRAYEYRELFPALIKDWRKQWGQDDFPFLFVQLANYQEESPEPTESSWAELREAQAMALALPNTGMATAIDIGEGGDIHPKNKADVGKRLGMAAMKTAYHYDERVSSGPEFKDMRIENDRIIIRYNHAGSGLITKDKFGYIRGFQVAGSDKKFYWAQAFLEGDHVIVKSKSVSDPVAIRYAWANNPGPLDLYNIEGLPAVPFRTDTWKGITSGNVYKEGPRF